MSVTVRQSEPDTETVGRVEVTDRTVREVASFTSGAGEAVHIERRGTRTYVVAE